MAKVKVTYVLNPERFKDLKEFKRPVDIKQEIVGSVDVARTVLAKKHNLEESQIKLLRLE